MGLGSSVFSVQFSDLRLGSQTGISSLTPCQTRGACRTLDSPAMRDLGSVMDEEEQTSDTAELAMNGQGYKSICTFGVRVRLGR